MSNILMANGAIRAWAPTVDFCRAATQPQRTIRVTGLSKSQAEDLLDWLEASGYRGYRLSYAADQGFTVSHSKSREAPG